MTGYGREGEGAVAVAERDVDAVVAEADDVGAAVAGEVGEEAGVLVDAPAPVVAEVVENEPGGWKVPSPLESATSTAASPKPTMSARPSRRTLGEERGCRSTRQPPASYPKSATTTRGGRNVPSPLPSDVHTPVPPNPTMSAPLVPVMSASEARMRSTEQLAESGATATDGTQ